MDSDESAKCSYSFEVGYLNISPLLALTLLKDKE